MRRAIVFPVALVLATVANACAGPPGQPTTPSAQTSALSAAPGRTVVFLTHVEPISLSELLAGEAQMALDNTLGFEQGAFLKREWAPPDAGRVLTWKVEGWEIK